MTDPNTETQGKEPLSEGLKGLTPRANRNIFMVALLCLILLLLIVFGKPAWGYMSCFLGAFTIFVLLRGQMRRLTERHHWKRGGAALLLVGEAIVFFLIPLGGIVSMLIDVFSNTTIDYNAIMQQVNEWNAKVEEQFGITLLTIDNLGYISSFGQRVVSMLVSGTYSLIINSIMMLFVLFYMLYERSAFENAIMELLPFSRDNKRILVRESRSIIVANAVGIPLLAIIQGIFAYIGYLIFGVKAALFYAVLTAFSTIIPVVGTMIVWIPLGIYFALTANWVGAIGIWAYGLIVIGGSDNVARLLLQKKLADIHPLITIFGVIFGMSLFGFWGVIFGPLLISLLILFINMFRHDYVPGSTAKARVTTSYERSAQGKRFNTVIKETAEKISQPKKEK